MSRTTRKEARMARMLLTLGALVAAATLSAPAHAAGGSFSDRTGDATSGAPDLTAVSVDESGGTTAFSLAVAGVSTLGSSHRYEVRIDSDANGQTGSHGTDQVLVLDGGNQQVSHWRWNGTAYELSAVSGLSATASAPFRLTIATASLGDPAKISFWVKSADVATGGRDDAPDSGVHSVTLRESPGGSGGGSDVPPPPPGPPTLGGPPALPQLPTPPSLPGNGLPQLPGQTGTPGTPGASRPDAKTTSPSAVRRATLVRTELTVISRRGRDFLTASMTFRLPKGAQVKTTCKGTLAGRALSLAPRRTGSTVTCAAPIARAASGTVRIRMTVKVGGRVFVRTFRGSLKRA